MKAHGPLSIAAATTSSLALAITGYSATTSVQLPSNSLEILRHMSIVYLPDGEGGTAKTIRIQGVNVQIVNGLQATNGNPQDPSSIEVGSTRVNAVGNLIVGYNEEATSPLSIHLRAGSHNVVVGSGSSYSSFGGIVAGGQNSVSAPYCSITGGISGHASGPFSSVNGGNGNHASGMFSAIAGGANNSVEDYHSAISGGMFNRATGVGAWVGGGLENLASGGSSAISGGSRNSAEGAGSSVSGGTFNCAAGDTSSILGGGSDEDPLFGSPVGNKAVGHLSVVCGGKDCTALGALSTVGGGRETTTEDPYDWAAGGLVEAGL